MLSLLKRGNVYYSRLRVPVDMQGLFGRKEVVQSLGVIRYKDAKVLLGIKIGKFERLRVMVDSGSLTDDIINQEVQKLIDNRISTFDKLRNKEIAYDDPELQYDGEEYVSYLDNAMSTDEGFDREVEESANFIALNKKVLARNKAVDDIGISTTARITLNRLGIVLDPSSPMFHKLCNELLKGINYAATITHEHLQGNFDTDYDATLRARTKSHTLKEALDAWCKIVKGNYKKNLISNKIKECFQEVTGKDSVLLSDIDHAMTIEVANRIIRYPAYRSTRHKGKSLVEIEALGSYKKCTEVVIKEELGAITGFYDFCISSQEGMRKNYALNLSTDMLETKHVKKSSKRTGFKEQDIIAIVEELRRLKLKGEFNNNPHMLLIPLICLYQGARANEICQLRIKDIKKVGNIWCFDIHMEEDDMRVKNANSVRTIPIHPALISLGLLKFVESQKSKGFGKLWDGMAKNKCTLFQSETTKPTHSKYLTDWFNDTFLGRLEKRGLLSEPDKLTFHSTRHTFCDWFYQARKFTEYASEIHALVGHLDKEEKELFKSRGWDVNATTIQIYTQELWQDTQLKVLKMLDYGVDLSELAI